MTKNIPVWLVGYQPEIDEIFMYFVDQDDLCWLFSRGRLNFIAMIEALDLSSAVILGEL